MRQTGLALVFAFLLGLAAAPACAQPVPSFECAKARSATEKTICDDFSLSWQDQQLNRLYGDVRQLLAESARTALRDEQRAWVGKRNACGGNGDCIGQLSRQRLQALSAQVNPRTLTGSFSYAEKGLAGDMTLVEFPGKRASGYIATVNTSTTHSCTVDMAGLTVDGQTLTWNDPEESDGQHCRVDITIGPGGAVVAANTCRSWCGMSGTFEGRYKRR